MRRLAIYVRPGEYAIARMDPAAELPVGLFDRAGDALVSVTRSGSELSVIGPASLWASDAPQRCDAGWRLMSVRGPLAFTLTGIIAALASELASAGVALFSLSTFDTDHILVKDADLDRAVGALQAAGHEVYRD